MSSDPDAVRALQLRADPIRHTAPRPNGRRSSIPGNSICNRDAGRSLFALFKESASMPK